LARKLEGAERMVLRSLLDLQGDSIDYIEDARIAATCKMFVHDVRDWLETLEGKGFVERARGTEAFSAYITAKGKQALRLTEPFPNPNSPSAVASSTIPTPPSALRPEAGSPSSHSAGTTGGTIRPMRLFYSYSHKDETLRDQLEEHLSLLKRQGYIVGWHDRRIGAGEEWRGQIDKNLEEAQIILLLISSSFLASDYCSDIETKRALERHDEGEAKVIPVIIRPCDWHEAPFAKLQSLPKDTKAVTSWPNQDEAWTDVALGIRRAVAAMTASPR